MLWLFGVSLTPRYIPGLFVMNKIDQLTIEELDIIDEMPNYVQISVEENPGLQRGLPGRQAVAAR